MKSPTTSADGSDASAIVTVRTDRVTCKIAPNWVASLREWLCEAPSDPAAWTGFELVKRSTVRSVWRGVIPGRSGEPALDVHVKSYRPVRLSDRARDALSGARGVREFDRLQVAAERGLPVVEPLAAGRWLGDPSGVRSFLITRTAHATPMPRRDFEPAAARAAGQLLRRAHDLGLHSDDLHPNNLLLAPDGSAILCDLTDAVLANPLEFEQRTHALAIFCLQLDGLVDDPSARALLDAYGADRHLVDAALRAGRRLRHRALAAYGRRATRACRETACSGGAKADGGEWFLRRDVSDEVLADVRAWHARQIAAGEPTARARKSGRRGAVFSTASFVAKRRSAADACRSFRAAYWLEFAGVPTPAPLALQLFDGVGHVFCARLPWPNLSEEFATLTTEERLAAARHLGTSVGRLHAHGLRNRDLKFENLIRDPRDHRVHMVDLDGVRVRLPLERRGQARDLGRLLAAYRHACDGQVDPTLLRGFFRSYHAAFLCLRAERNHRLARHIEARAREWANAHPSTATSS